MPKSINLFERLAYLALIFGLVSGALNWPADTNVDSAMILFFVAYIGVQILLIWLIARKRKNWARWVWIAVVFGGTAAAIITGGAHPILDHIIQALAYYLVYLVSILSACLLLTPTSWAWFRNK